MSQDKELLLKDLCARLPYGVKVQMADGAIEELLNVNVNTFICNGLRGLPQPYLFPLSSMTEEQKQEHSYIVNYISPDDTKNWKESEFIYVEQATQLMHFYHINYLDYRGLIEKGLALDATGKNIYE